MVKSQFVPHQLHLTKDQQKKLHKGQNVNLKHSQMGADKGDTVIMLKPQNARKLLTSYKKGKGMRLGMSQDEIDETVGSGFFQFTNKVLGLTKRETVNGLKDVMKPVAGVLGSMAGEAIGMAMEDPIAGEMIGYALSEGATTLIDSLAPSKGKAGMKFDANYDEKQMRKDIEKETREKMYKTIDTTLPVEMRPIAKETVDKHIATVIEEKPIAPAPPPQKESDIDVGFGIKKVSSNSMETRKMLEKMGVKFKKGGKIHLVDVVDNPVVRPVLDAASDRAVRAIEGSGYKNPLLVKGSGAKKRLVKGSAEAKAHMAKIRGMKKGGKIHLVDVVDNPVVRPVLDAASDRAVRAIEGSGSLLKSGSEAVSAVDRRAKNDIRRLKGMGAKMSAPYKQAMKYNKDTYGLEVGGFSTDNAPVSKFSTNPRVKPSSTEMTLSPYQNMSSPAMNPFVPKNYTQEGGVSCGYGGRGLYAGGLYAGGLGKRAERKAKDRLLSFI
jgi:hypothetical protein